jgi:hypothetical protein
MAVTAWLIGKSALARLAASPDAAEWASRIERGLVRITTVTRLEVGYSARTGTELRTGLRQPPLASMPVEYLTPAIENRALEVLSLLADRGQHRAPSIPDMIIAANPMWARVTLGVLGELASPLALAEEYIGRTLLNVPFVVQNGGM